MTMKTPFSFGAASALSPITPARTAAEEVEERLIMAIARGDKQPNERVTEAEIASALNVSRVPVREAMQKLQLRGILVDGPQRGLRVLDYSEKRIVELFGLRLAVEKIIFQHVMASGRDNRALFADLERILHEMGALSSSEDPVALSSTDLSFHRAIARHSGNVLAAQIWEGLAQHMMIVFCRHWSHATNMLGEVDLHRNLIHYLKKGSIADVDEVLLTHFSDPAARTVRS